jgi:hypothetical protein
MDECDKVAETVSCAKKKSIQISEAVVNALDGTIQNTVGDILKLDYLKLVFSYVEFSFGTRIDLL